MRLNFLSFAMIFSLAAALPAAARRIEGSGGNSLRRVGDHKPLFEMIHRHDLMSEFTP